MLLLTRRPGEEIIIADNIRIKVVEIQNGQVRLGIEAPANVAVDRSEVRRRKIACMRNHARQGEDDFSLAELETASGQRVVPEMDDAER